MSELNALIAEHEVLSVTVKSAQSALKDIHKKIESFVLPQGELDLPVHFHSENGSNWEAMIGSRLNWDKDKLLDLYRNNPEVRKYISLTPSVSSQTFKNLPPEVRELFEPAVELSRNGFKLQMLNDGVMATEDGK